MLHFLLGVASGEIFMLLTNTFHSFSSTSLVLQKYQIDAKQRPNQQTVNDPFYDVLKQRVADTLMAQGIDPEKDRTAPPLRVAYYFLILTCLIVSARAHIQVCDFTTIVECVCIDTAWVHSFLLTITLGEFDWLLSVCCLWVADWCPWARCWPLCSVPICACQ